ncbi:MarR family transcriptional regulator [Robbsia sp. KACC 23696]|uniref:MarR family winged helix-turn-helix transcriptional regulator n=1 Tax=Robbsia sp. KACC 23696 TaxID=3149231 RepID=UPI00325BAD7D
MSLTVHQNNDRSNLTVETLAEDVRRAVGTFVRAVREKTDAEKSAQTEALGLLDRDGPMNIAALAQRRNVTHQTMRLVVGQLENARLVERQADPTDGRSQIFSLSAFGKAELLRGRAARASKIGDMIEKTLTADERIALKTAVGILDKLSAAAGG